MGVSVFNTGYDLQDQIDAAESAIAIVSIGDTHVAITSGQYVYVREHGTLAEGLYRATANIAANGTLSSSNVTAVSGGGLNALNSNIANKAENKIGTITTGASRKEKILLLIDELNTYIGNTTKNLVFSYGITGAGVATGTCGKNKEVVGNILYFEFTLDSKLYSGYYISSSNYVINEHTGTAI